MSSGHLDPVRADLAALRARFARGELDEVTYQRQRELVLADLTAEERKALGPATPTPQPAGHSSARPGASPSGPIGPSGGVGGGARTALLRRAAVTPQPGRVLFEQWQLERELERGGFGVVFEATDRNIGRKQAVKIVDPAMGDNADSLARSRCEVLVMRRPVHPRMVRVFDYRVAPQEALGLLSTELVTQTLQASNYLVVETPSALQDDTQFHCVSARPFASPPSPNGPPPRLAEGEEGAGSALEDLH